jgi:hypothetical protein
VEPPAAPPRDEIALLVENWREILDYVGRAASLARNALLDARPQKVSPAEVVIGFDPEFADNREKVDSPRVRKALGKKLGQLLGRDVAVSFGVLEEDAEAAPLPTDHVPAAERATPPEHPPEPTPPVEAAPEGKEPGDEPAGRPTASRADWHHDPAVQKTLEMFHGDIVDIRD